MFTPELIPDNHKSDQSKKRFPAVMQLGVLAVILTVLFNAFFWPSKSDNQNGVFTEYQAPAGESAILSTTIPRLENVPVIARSVFVYDVAQKRVLYSRNPDEVLPLASITKLMTALLAYELLDENTSLTVPTSAFNQDGGNLYIGERFTLQSLLQLAMVASANDAAHTIASEISAYIGDTQNEAIFVEAMNLRAQELKLSTLRFYNATGLDVSANQAGGYGSARDINFLMNYLYQTYPNLLEMSTDASNRIFNEAGAHHDIRNTNRSLTSIPNLLGSKTGYTDLAGGNLTVMFNAGFMRPIIITVLGSTFTERFSDVELLATEVIHALGDTTEGT